MKILSHHMECGKLIWDWKPMAKPVEARTWSISDRRDALKKGLYRLTDEELKKAYNDAKQLSDLCWQEIKRRKEKQ